MRRGGDAKESRARVTCESHGYQIINVIIGVFYKGRRILLLGTGLTSKSEMRFRTTQQAMGKTLFSREPSWLSRREEAASFTKMKLLSITCRVGGLLSAAAVVKDLLPSARLRS